MDIMPLESEISAIIPSSTLTDVARLLGSVKEVEVKYNDEQVAFIIGETSVTSLLIDGKYIDYINLIPTNTSFTITINRAEFIKITKVAELFARETAGEFIKITKVAELFARETAGSIILEGDPAGKTLSVRSITSQLGENTSSIEADIVASGTDDCMVSLNSKFLLDALNCIEGDQVTMSFNGKMSPVLLTGQDTNYRHVIMPVKSW